MLKNMEAIIRLKEVLFIPHLLSLQMEHLIISTQLKKRILPNFGTLCFNTRKKEQCSVLEVIHMRMETPPLPN